MQSTSLPMGRRGRKALHTQAINATCTSADEIQRMHRRRFGKEPAIETTGVMNTAAKFEIRTEIPGANCGQGQLPAALNQGRGTSSSSSSSSSSSTSSSSSCSSSSSRSTTL